MAAVCLFAVETAAAQDVPSIRLLPTDREAARVRALKDALDKHLTDDVLASYSQLKTIVQDFVIRQLDAAPAISDAMLREQLRKVIGRTWPDPPDSGLDVSSATAWGPRSTQRLWAVAYAVWLGTHGPGGTGVVIDSYVWEPGRTRGYLAHGRAQPVQVRRAATMVREHARREGESGGRNPAGAEKQVSDVDAADHQQTRHGPWNTAQPAIQISFRRTSSPRTE